MIENVLYIILAIFGIGFLIFIHEFGHFLMAKRKKMKVEVFSIGFGKPILSWKRKGIKWQIGIFPFGGYVKIAGMEKKGKKEPFEIKDGFFGKKPFDRIQVAFAGPFVNFLFAFIAFFLIWAFGGREKPFSEVTKKIGFVEQSSDLYKNGVCPGDVILKYDGKQYKGFRDIIYGSVTQNKEAEIEGDKIFYYDNKKKFFKYELSKYKKKPFFNFYSIGIDAPASFLIFEKKDANLSINPNDRLIWANGDLIFSMKQFVSIINGRTVFLKVKRGKKIFFTKIIKPKIEDLKLTKEDLDEINDWKYETLIKKNLEDMYFIPYFFNEEAKIEKKLDFIEKDFEKKLFTRKNPFENSLQVGDKILSVDGKNVFSSFDILKNLQTRSIQIIVQRNKNFLDDKKISYKNADKKFDLVFTKNVKQIIENLLLEKKDENFILLNMAPLTLESFIKSLKKTSSLYKSFLAQEKKIDSIKNIDEKNEAKRIFLEKKQKLVLPILFSLQDIDVKYNPNPLVLFKNSFIDTWRTLFSLVSGNLSPKWMSGPIGILQVMKASWSIGVLEALFWLGVISLNLGFINLLPIPALDGGYILLSIIEMITKKPIKAKTMEKLIIPFIIFLIAAFIFITYHDILRIFKRFF